MDKIRWGIIGPGNIAAKFAAALNHVESGVLEAVASRDVRRADDFAKKFGAHQVVNSYEELVSIDEIDAVYIATPHSFHHDHSLLALNKNKAVLCEKPLAVSALQAQNIINVARNRGVFLMEALWTRFLPAIIQSATLLSAGEIGELLRIEADFSFRKPIPDTHRLAAPGLAGGAILDLGVYVLNGARIFSGMWPEDQFSALKTYHTGVDEHALITQSYRGDLLAQLSCAFTVEGHRKLRVTGTDGELEIPGTWIDAQSARIRNSKGERVIDTPHKKNGFEYQIEEVHRCMRAGKTESEIMPLSETLKIQELMDDCLKNLS